MTTSLPAVLDVAGLRYDFSRHAVDGDALFARARQMNFDAQRTALLTGGIVNPTEARAANHVHLRSTPEFARRHGMQAFAAQARAERERAQALAEQARRRFRHVIHVGIGGSYCGPRAVFEALKLQHEPLLDLHFLANPDLASIRQITRRCDAERTLVVLCSKSFTTEEVVFNAQHLLAWMRECGVRDAIGAGQVIAVTARADRAAAAGFPPGQTLLFDETIGGRYSLWSACGFPLLCAFGAAPFDALLAGAHAADAAFADAPAEDNAAFIAGALSWHYRAHARIPVAAMLLYGDAFAAFAPHVQQVVMESLGKSVTIDGQPCDVPGPYMLVETGPAVQHTFMQMLRQGPLKVPVEIVTADDGGAQPYLERAAAQARALHEGGIAPGEAQWAAHRAVPGGHGVTAVQLPDLSPRALGALLATLEHRVFCEAVLAGINAFDQFGVELLKSRGDGSAISQR
jgi:glucose-6-phosphate isomerase